MAESTMLEKIKYALSITGNDMDNTLTQWMNIVVGYMENAGVKPENIKPEVVAMGVGDIWHYGGNDARFSTAFERIVIQLAYK